MRLHWIAVGLLTALFLAPLAAGAEEPAGFLIETITVEGTRRAAANIVEAETRLREGQTYTEEDLRQAVYRVHRLPFVLDATFSLRKGSQRGSYELVIQVVPAKWFFFDHSIRATHFDEPLNLEGNFGGQETTYSFPGLIGARLFVGRSGVLFGALDSEEGFQAGYSQYDLFGRGIVASLGYSHIPENVCCVTEVLPYALDPAFVSWGWDGYDRTSLNLGIPLRKNQSLQIGWTRKSGGSGLRTEVLDRFELSPLVVDISGSGRDMTYDRAEVKWVLDTSDDPLVPTRGFTLSAGLEAATFETDGLLRVRYVLGGPFEPEFEDLPPYEARSVAAVVSAARHWSLTPRQTVSGTGRLSLGRSSIHDLPTTIDGAIGEADLDVYGVSAGLQHAISLRRTRGEKGFGDLRWETGLEVGVEGSSPRLGLDTPNPLERLSVSTGLVYRNPWGRLRFQLTYLDIGEVRGEVLP